MSNSNPPTMYTEEVLEHFQNPHNYGKIKNPDGVGKVGNFRCGDVMWLYLKINDDEIIKDIKFETYGCLAAIATSSVVTDLVKGKTIEQAMELDREQVVEKLQGLPPVKMHCSVLAVDALLEAIYNYLDNHNKKIPEQLEQRHKKIKREREQIKEKYEDWANLEQKLHQQDE